MLLHQMSINILNQLWLWQKMKPYDLIDSDFLRTIADSFTDIADFTQLQTEN